MPEPLVETTYEPDADADAPVWHALAAESVLARLAVDPASGLSASEAAERLARFGPNALPEAEPRPKWLLFLDQFRNLLVLLLVIGAVVAGAVGDVKDAVVIALVLIVNAILGYVQEQRAENSLAALRQLLILRARVRRGGTEAELDAGQLVPGDIVMLEAGERVPADGRLLQTFACEVDESALTGESVPSTKDATAAVRPDEPLGDRVTMLYLNTQLTQGRAVMVVTATGSRTEVGRIAELVTAGDDTQTPLQRQLDSLGRRLAMVSGVAVAVYFALGLVRGEAFADTLVASVALIVAAIPEGLPAVVTLTLAIGTRRLAERGAIVKRLASVETLGSTSVICSDKTGTLTLNEMTAQQIVTDGDVRRVASFATGEDVADPLALRLAEDAVLCNDSIESDDGLIGDPTETALLVLATAVGLEPRVLRARAPRVGELPFDSARRYMATVHDRGGVDGAGPGRLLVAKGAWEALADRSTRVITAAGVVALDDETRAKLHERTHELAEGGLRVLVVAERDLPGASVPVGSTLEPEAVDDLARDLTIVGLVALLDPPREEAAAAIARCREAGIDVKMITGDHALTAGAIARAVGIEGRVLQGRELDDLDDDALDACIGEVGVIARVSPEHKIRVVRSLRRIGRVVAMTGDGVNDAPALAGADIGVAMGTTGTDVAKEASDMILTDDNFATITKAVEQGRAIYGNIVKFVRFQLTTNIGALSTLIGAELLRLPPPFNPIQVLWVNLIMDGPPAMALGVDPPNANVMHHAPRDASEQILTRTRLWRVVFSGVLMAVVTLAVFASARTRGSEEYAVTMAFTTFVFFQVVNALIVRSETLTVFRRDSLQNGKLWIALGAVLVAQVLALHWEPLQSVFGTTDISGTDWVVAAAAASLLLWVDEVRKFFLRRRLRA